MGTTPTRLAVCLAAAALFATVSCSVPESADISAANPSIPAATTPPAVKQLSTDPSSAAAVSCTSNYSAGAYSLDIIMQNNTGQNLVLDPTRTGRGDGHWAAQPPTSLAPGACAVINAYSDDPLDLLWVTATYLLPDGTFIPFACQSQDDPVTPHCNANALLTMNETTYGPFSGTVTDAWYISTAASSGNVHTHWTLIAEPQTS